MPDVNGVQSAKFRVQDLFPCYSALCTLNPALITVPIELHKEVLQSVGYFGGAGFGGVLVYTAVLEVVKSPEDAAAVGSFAVGP